MCPHLRKVVNEQGCRRRGRLDTSVRHHVEHALVALVPNTRDDRQGEISHVFGQQQGVETAHVGRCTASPYDDNDVEAVGFSVNGVESSHYTLLNAVALHHRRKQNGHERKAVIVIR